jgi:HSP20 family protein
MDLIQWKPGREVGPWRRLREIEDEMDSLLGRFLGREPQAPGRERMWAPVVDVKETKADIIVKAELPEVNAKDVDIAVDGKVLTIKGERKSEEEKKDEGYYYSERSWGSFVRSLTLPGEVDEAKTKASYKDGVLPITMPRKKEAKAKQIKVNVE